MMMILGRMTGSIKKPFFYRRLVILCQVWLCIQVAPHLLVTWSYLDWRRGLCCLVTLGLGFIFVIQEIERGGQEKHAPQDDDEGTKHEGIAQTQEPPQCWCSVLLLKGVRDQAYQVRTSCITQEMRGEALERDSCCSPRGYNNKH